MSWNYRVVRDAFGNLAIHEVFYDRKGRPAAYTTQPVGFYCSAEEDVSMIFLNLHRAARNVLNLPILEDKDFKGKM